MLTQERLKELLDYDPETGVFVWKVNRGRTAKAGTPAGNKNHDGYNRIMVDGKHYMAHRLAWFYVYGVWPANELDHINRERGDNKISNLRKASRLENMWNRARHSNNTSGYAGVSWSKLHNKWRADIQVNGKGKHLGLFNTPEEAHTAYLAAKEELHNIGDQQ